MKWSKEDIEKAVFLNKSGMRLEGIAKELNRSFRSVQVKLNKLGYKQNTSNIREKIVCLNCGGEFIGMINDSRKFCCRSCSAKYNNRKYPKRVSNFVKLKKCLNCGNDLNSNQNKFCSVECSNTYKQNLIFNNIESGNTTYSSDTYKKYLIFKCGDKCMKCGWHEINQTTGLVPIQLEHKDGNSDNNSLNNLELLCPNCHSLTPTYGALNKGNGRTKRREKRNENKNLLKKL
jgi:hypothetical protein